MKINIPNIYTVTIFSNDTNVEAYHEDEIWKLCIKYDAYYFFSPLKFHKLQFNFTEKKTFFLKYKPSKVKEKLILNEAKIFNSIGYFIFVIEQSIFISEI